MKGIVKKYSYRDPDGFVLGLNGCFYRVVYNSFAEDLKLIEENKLLSDPRIIKHTPIQRENWPPALLEWLQENDNLASILRIFEIEKINHISYPWEWTPGMLKDAALCTIELQTSLLPLGLSLKDASYYNVQFINARPYFIDLLSIKKTTAFYPWHPYGQFLKHFIFPLSLLKYTGFNTNVLLSSLADGIDKNMIAACMPIRSYFNIYELLNIHLLKRLKVNAFPQHATSSTNDQIKKARQLLLFTSSYIKGLSFKKTTGPDTGWERYYAEDVAEEYQLKKIDALQQMLSTIPFVDQSLDLGANTGFYSEMLLPYSDKVISLEQNIACCESIRERILMSTPAGKEWAIFAGDLLSPSPSTGWMNKERAALLERISSTLVLSLALIHHLYFKGSLYFDEISSLFNEVTKEYLIVEFIEPSDIRVKELSQQNNTRLLQYNVQGFISAINIYFQLIQQKSISDTRTMFLFHKIQKN